MNELYQSKKISFNKLFGWVVINKSTEMVNVLNYLKMYVQETTVRFPRKLFIIFLFKNIHQR